jgi:trigger factor
MEYKVKKNNNATAEIQIQFTSEELEFGFQKAYEKSRDKVKVPGFRPGKAPLKTIEKILGDSVAEDAINFALNDAIVQIFPKLDPIPLRIPRFEVEQFDRTKGFTAKANYDTYPEVTLPKYKKVKIETYEVSPSDADLSKELETIRRSMGRNILKEEGDPVEQGNLLEIQYRFAMEGESLPEKINTGKYQMGESKNPPGFDDQLLGMKLDETRTFDFTYPSDFPASPESAGKKYTYEVKVTAMYRVQYPELDNDFASEYDGSESLDALKAKLKENMTKKAQEDLKIRSMTEIYEKLVEEAKFVIPENLVKEEAENVYQQMFSQYRVPAVSMEEYAKNTDQTLAEVQDRFQKLGLKRLQVYFLRHKVAEEEKITVTEEEWRERLGSLAAMFQESLESFEKRMQKEGRLDSIRDNILLEKVDNFIYDAVEKKNPKTISLDEVSKLLNREIQTA